MDIGKHWKRMQLTSPEMYCVWLFRIVHITNYNGKTRNQFRWRNDQSRVLTVRVDAFEFDLRRIDARQRAPTRHEF